MMTSRSDRAGRLVPAALAVAAMALILAPTAEAADRKKVLVELFTSQG